MNMTLPLVDIVLGSVESEANNSRTTVPFCKLKQYNDNSKQNNDTLYHLQVINKRHLLHIFTMLPVYITLHSNLPDVPSYLNCRKGSPVLVSSISLQLTMCAHHLTLIAEPKLGLWLLQDGDVRSIMVDG